MINSQIIEFLKEQIKKGHSEEFLKQGLLNKGWPIQDINDSLIETKNQLAYVEPLIKPLPQQREIKKQIEEQPIIQEKKRIFNFKFKGQLNAKSISFTFLAFIGVFALISFTILVFFYMNGITDYSVNDPITGQLLKRTCLYEDCSDMKESALDFAKEKINLSIILGMVTSLLIILIYKLITFKKIFFWICNVLYLISLAIIAYLWFSFSLAH